jgi:Tol biopolymer transport system component
MEMRTLVLTIAVVCGLAVGAAAQATAPGKNGPIAFRRFFDSAKSRGAVFVVQPDGSGAVQVTHPPKLTVDDQPDWSPDGSLLVFSRCPYNGACGIYTVRSDGSGLTRISPPCPARGRPPECSDDTLPAFSPDGRRIVFGSQRRSWSDIVVADVATRAERVVLHGSARASFSDPQLAPDGGRLMVVETLKRKQAIFITDLEGGQLNRVTPWSLAAGDNPDWSPDGRWILFRSHEGGGPQSQIYVVHPDGSGLTQLTHFKEGTIVTSSSFSPDGTSIVFGSTGVGGNADLFVMRSDGTGIHPITRTKLWDSAPDWGPSR